MHKRILTLLLALALALTALPAWAVEDEVKEFTVASTTQLKGDFMGPYFGNNAADVDVRVMLHAYDLVRWDENQGVWIIDPTVVQLADTHLDAEGNKVYSLTLWNDLYYSDGSPITAWGYAFSMLLTMSNEIAELGGKPNSVHHILGADAYLNGEVPYVAGIGVTDDYTLNVVLDKDFLPYYYEVNLLKCEPFPIGEIAPECRVYSDGEDRNWNAPVTDQIGKTWYGMGAYLGNLDLTDETPRFTADMLRETLLDETNGYNTYPKVVSGPYTLESFDGLTAHFKLNPYFKGVLPKELIDGVEPNGYFVIMGRTLLDTPNDLLIHPSIERVAFTQADNALIISEMLSGEVQLANRLLYAPTVEEGMEFVREGELRYKDYPRIGFSFVNFSYELPTVSDPMVRQAIAWCMDRDHITQEYCGPTGYRVDGFYGIEQWEYLLATHKMDAAINFQDDPVHPVADDADWASLSMNLTEYRVDIDRANALLDEAGWTLNPVGEPFNPETDFVRAKEVDGELALLSMTMLYPEGNMVSELMGENFVENLNSCGIQLELVPMDMTSLLRQYYRQVPRTADMIYLANQFHLGLDPSFVAAGDLSVGHWSWNGVYTDDETLYELALDMRRTDPTDTFAYVEKWIRFQERYNEILPSLPVYSNVYYDFFTPSLSGYVITAHDDWAEALFEATWNTETPETTPEPTLEPTPGTELTPEPTGEG